MAVLGSGVGLAPADPSGVPGVGTTDALGAGIGAPVGRGVGRGVGAAVGAGVGRGVGAAVGRGVGRGVGAAVGAGVGAAVGAGVGAAVGAGVGAAVGRGVGAGGCVIVTVGPLTEAVNFSRSTASNRVSQLPTGGLIDTSKRTPFFQFSDAVIGLIARVDPATETCTWSGGEPSEFR